MQNRWVVTMWKRICGNILPQLMELAVLRLTACDLRRLFLKLSSPRSFFSIFWQSSKLPLTPMTLTFSELHVTICWHWIWLIPFAGYITNTASLFLYFKRCNHISTAHVAKITSGEGGGMSQKVTKNYNFGVTSFMDDPLVKCAPSSKTPKVQSKSWSFKIRHRVLQEHVFNAIIQFPVSNKYPMFLALCI